VQTEFGREMSQLSRIDTTVREWLLVHHQHKVVNNLDWYADRFDDYASAVNTAIAASVLNQQGGTVPQEIINIFSFLDCCVYNISRAYVILIYNFFRFFFNFFFYKGNNNLQNSFWNRYYHGHVIQWLGCNFPDGMTVIDGPNAGFLTDTMVWATSRLRADMLVIRAQRQAAGLRDVFMYADKIFRTDNIILIAAYSARWGFVQPWMVNLNEIMSKLRVSVEWWFGKVKYLFKSISFALNLRVQVNNAPVGDFILGAFFTNCRTCLNWDGPFRGTFGVRPPDFDDYMNQ